MEDEIIDYGVTRLALIPVRKEPDHRAEQVTQLLFGDHYEILNYSKERNWVYIRIYEDQYRGWIDISQHHAISSEYFNHINRANYRITTDLFSTILYKKYLITIPAGSIVPISSSELFKMEERLACSGESKASGQKRDFDFLHYMALKYLGVPYLWGGKSPFGIDCSGFAQIIFKICGYNLPRDAYQQADKGKDVAGLQHARSGDLCFFLSPEGAISHVGILLGEEKIIHASGKVRIDSLTEEGILNQEKEVITHPLFKIKRLLVDLS